MPFSSPSYFPPQRATDRIVGLNAGIGQTGNRVILGGLNAGRWTTQSDLVVLGSSALSAGTQAVPLTDVNSQGTTILGSQAGTALTNFSAGITGPVTLIGWQAAQSLVNTGSLIVIGAQALSNASGAGRSQATVIIGTQALQNAQVAAGGNNVDNSVVIGSQALQGTGGVGNMSILSCVVIGASAVVNYPTGGGGSLDSCVLIGQNVTPGLFNSVRNTFVGQGVGAAATSGLNNNTMIGQGIAFNLITDCVGLGRAVIFNAQTGAIAIGSGGVHAAGDRSTVIGFDANTSTIDTAADRLIMESFDGITVRSMFFGDMNLGNLIVGKTSVAQRGLITTPNGANNILQIAQGLPSGTSPTSSGYLYVEGVTNTDRILRYVNATGLDQALGSSGPAFEGTGLGVISPAALAAGSTPDYAPAGFGQSQILRLSANAAGSTLSGLAGGAAGRTVTITNVSANTLTLTNQDAGSLAANRFSLPGAASVALTANGSITLWYDTTTGNWRSLFR